MPPQNRSSANSLPEISLLLGCLLRHKVLIAVRRYLGGGSVRVRPSNSAEPGVANVEDLVLCQFMRMQLKRMIKDLNINILHIGLLARCHQEYRKD